MKINFYFNPNAAADIWRWIPQGLPYDLVDASGEATPIVDNVNSYTNRLCYDALQSDVRSIQVFGNRILQQNINLQQMEVRQLFTNYRYAF